MDSDDTSVRAGVCIFGPVNCEYMDWQDILMIAIAVLLLLVWVPLLFISVRKALREGEFQVWLQPKYGNKTGV